MCVGYVQDKTNKKGKIAHYTLSWSPWKSCRKLAWVPVVPFTPRKRRSSRARCRLRMSMVRSCSHKHARFPTVVSWAGLWEMEVRRKPETPQVALQKLLKTLQTRCLDRPPAAVSRLTGSVWSQALGGRHISPQSLPVGQWLWLTVRQLAEAFRVVTYKAITF